MRFGSAKELWQPSHSPPSRLPVSRSVLVFLDQLASSLPRGGVKAQRDVKQKKPGTRVHRQKTSKLALVGGRSVNMTPTLTSADKESPKENKYDVSGKIHLPPLVLPLL